ncbi:hypothetical protein HMPREF0971_02719 [Segatella oris F0302]|uniref:Uncharacterized protein n=1 Tax=Segatella oris F0302 TaxID=649760 RepID=D1QUN4_9BACT|nr:hypothetical protein HMPREF0971_02719 [Segatella oris F0302]
MLFTLFSSLFCTYFYNILTIKGLQTIRKQAIFEVKRPLVSNIQTE